MALSDRLQLVASETANMRDVLDHPAFKSDPFGAIQAHLQSTVDAQHAKADERRRERVERNGGGDLARETPLVYNKERWTNPHFIAYGKVAKKKGKMWGAMMGSSKAAKRGSDGSSGGGTGTAGQRTKNAAATRRGSRHYGYDDADSAAAVVKTHCNGAFFKQYIVQSGNNII